MYFKFLDGKEKIEANGLICRQKYGSQFTALLVLGISYQIRLSSFILFYFFNEVINLFIYVQIFKFIFIYYCTFAS